MNKKTAESEKKVHFDQEKNDELKGFLTIPQQKLEDYKKDPSSDKRFQVTTSLLIAYQPWLHIQIIQQISMEQEANKLSDNTSKKYSSSKYQNNIAPKPTLLQQFTQETYQKISHRKVNIRSMPYRELCQYYIGLRRYMQYEIGQIQAVDTQIQYQDDNHLQDKAQTAQKKTPPKQPLKKYLKIKIISSLWEGLVNFLNTCYRFFCRPEVQVSEGEQELQSLHQKKPADKPHKIVATSQPPRAKKK